LAEQVGVYAPGSAKIAIAFALDLDEFLQAACGQLVANLDHLRSPGVLSDAPRRQTKRPGLDCPASGRGVSAGGS
jgi:hypothetical protein